MFIECAPLFNSYPKRFEVIPADQPQVFLWSWRPSLRRDKLEWRSHPKSMSLGQLAMRVASIPGNLSRLVQADEFDASQANFTPPTPGSVEEILTAHDEVLRAASV